MMINKTYVNLAIYIKLFSYFKITLIYRNKYKIKYSIHYNN